MSTQTSYLQVSRGTLIATLPRADDGAGFDAMQAHLLERLHKGDEVCVVVDASYLSTIDLHEFARLRRLLLMVETMGSRCALCGVQPAVAATLVTLDADVEGIDAFADLDAALDALVVGAPPNPASQEGLTDADGPQEGVVN